MIGVIDSKICNIFSLINMLKKLGAEFIVTTSKHDLDRVNKIILPGVGAFPRAMENLEKFDLITALIRNAKAGKPVLGICLGMQLLFEHSLEFGQSKGLGLIPGRIIKIKTPLVLPHMGWNDLTITQQIPLLKQVDAGADVYFVHSFRAETADKHIAAVTDYGEKIPAVVYCQNIYGTQFHPEKSKKWGENILTNFINL